jgi:hypothetical protein
LDTIYFELLQQCAVSTRFDFRIKMPDRCTKNTKICSTKFCCQPGKKNQEPKTKKTQPIFFSQNSGEMDPAAKKNQKQRTKKLLGTGNPLVELNFVVKSMKCSATSIFISISTNCQVFKSCCETRNLYVLSHSTGLPIPLPSAHRSARFSST